MGLVLKLYRLSIYDELGELTTEPVCPFLKLAFLICLGLIKVFANCDTTTGEDQ